MALARKDKTPHKHCLLHGSLPRGSRGKAHIADAGKSAHTIDVPHLVQDKLHKIRTPTTPTNHKHGKPHGKAHRKEKRTEGNKSVPHGKSTRRAGKTEESPRSISLPPPGPRELPWTPGGRYGIARCGSLAMGMLQEPLIRLLDPHEILYLGEQGNPNIERKRVVYKCKLVGGTRYLHHEPVPRKRCPLRNV